MARMQLWIVTFVLAVAAIGTMTVINLRHADIAAASEREVEAVTRARLEQPDVILMDIQMPVMDRERCLAAGASDYMTTPVSMRALAAVVTHLATQSMGNAS